MNVDFEVYLLHLADRPLLLLLMLFLVTFLLEDVATTTAALLSAAGFIDIVPAVLVLFLGIVLGDCLLYLAGYWAQNWRQLRDWLQNKTAFKKVANWQRHQVGLILLARFLPGLRLPTYSAMGYLQWSAPVFYLTVVIGVGIWTTTLFSLVYMLGEAALALSGYLQLIAISAIIILGLLLPSVIGRVMQRLQKT